MCADWHVIGFAFSLMAFGKFWGSRIHYLKSAQACAKFLLFLILNPNQVFLS